MIRNNLNRIVVTFTFIVTGICTSMAQKQNVTVHAVTDLSHEFSFYADHRFYTQYLPNQKGVTNWCNLYNFNFDNANLLILLSCDDRISYLPEDIKAIKKFLKNGGGVVIFGTDKTRSQNQLLRNFGIEFTSVATMPLETCERFSNLKVEGGTGAVLAFDRPQRWDVFIRDTQNKAVMAKTNVGKGTLLVASRSLAGSNPSARDSINSVLWKTLLPEIASGKKINAGQTFSGNGIEDLEYREDLGSFLLSYNDYMKPYAQAMEDIYKKTFPYIEKRMGVPLAPGMASEITLLATGGGGFSSGEVIGLAVWWGGFPEHDESMIEFLTHESVHSWVLPFPEVWNEPIATYVGNLVMLDTGYKDEAEKRIENTIGRAMKYDPSMTNYDLNGNLTGEGAELSAGEKNDIHWGKTYWIFEQLRKEKPDLLAEYFTMKRQCALPGKISEYDINDTVEILSKVMKKDLFPWFNAHGIKVEKAKAEVDTSMWK